MGSVERRVREKHELRERIVEAARRLFARDGYEAVTMRRVAEAIEYSPTAIYLHFEDKDALLAEIVRRDFLALAAHFQRLASDVDDPVERLAQCGRAYVDFGLKHPHHYQLMFMAPRPRVGAMVDDSDPRVSAYAYLRALIAACKDARRLRKDAGDVDTVAQLCWTAMHGIVALAIAHRNDRGLPLRKPKQLTDAMLDVLVRGLMRESR